MMIEELKLLKYTILIFKADPCKKCLVRACCTQLCKEKKDLLYFLGYDSIKSKRLYAASIWFSVLNLTISMFIVWL